jgi:hypothetical protein
MPNPNPHVLVEMTNEPDCRFVAAWLTKAAEAQDFWAQALNHAEFANEVQLLWVMAFPDLAVFALEIFGELEHRLHVAVADLYADENGLFCTEFALLMRLGFFIEVGDSYHMAIPGTMSLAAVKQAALDVLSTARDEGDGLEVLQPERLLHTVSRPEAERSRTRLIEMRRFDHRAPGDRTIQ